MLALLCSAILFGGFGQSASVSTPLLTPEQMKSDLRLAHDIFAADDAGYYRYTSKEVIDAAWTNAEKKISKPMDAFGFYRILMPAVAAHKCGHSGAQLPKAILDDLRNKQPILPFYVKQLSIGTYVFRDLAMGTPNYDGSKIVAINGVLIQKIVDTMLTSMPMENSLSGKRFRASGRQFSIYLISLLGLSSPYSVELDRPGGHHETVKLDGIDAPTFAKRAVEMKAESGDETPADFKMLEGNIGLLTVRGFFDQDGTHPTSKIFEDAFKAVDEKKSKALTIDLRNNGGGEDELGRRLLAFLENKPFKYYDHLLVNGTYFKSSAYTGNYQRPPENMLTRRPDGRYELTGHPNWGIMQPTQPHFAGKVYILINGGSYSTTCEFLSHVKSDRLATVIGQETGGNYYGNTSGISNTVTLPNTQCRIVVPSVAYWISVDHRFPPESPVRPDIKLEPKIGDLLAGRDIEMERALKLARAG